MDPASIIWLTAAIQQLLTCIYNMYSFGRSVRDAKKDINHLCSELLALKAALEHIQLNLNTGRNANPGSEEKFDAILSSPLLESSECNDMVSSTRNVVQDLLVKLESKPSRTMSSRQRITWPFVREDVMRYIGQIERAKGWFILATTSDNMYEVYFIFSSHSSPTEDWSKGSLQRIVSEDLCY